MGTPSPAGRGRGKRATLRDLQPQHTVPGPPIGLSPDPTVQNTKLLWTMALAHQVEKVVTGE